MTLNLSSLLQRLDAAAQRYFTHLVGQGGAFAAVSQTNLTKLEDAALSAGVLACTLLLKRAQRWLRSKA